MIGRYGPHLMIVMTVLTQNNFENGPGISDRLLGFLPKTATGPFLFCLDKAAVLTDFSCSGFILDRIASAGVTKHKSTFVVVCFVLFLFFSLSPTWTKSTT